jgi:hypothetical protein
MMAKKKRPAGAENVCNVFIIKLQIKFSNKCIVQCDLAISQPTYDVDEVIL